MTNRFVRRCAAGLMIALSGAAVANCSSDPASEKPSPLPQAGAIGSGGAPASGGTTSTVGGSASGGMATGGMRPGSGGTGIAGGSGGSGPASGAAGKSFQGGSGGKAGPSGGSGGGLASGGNAGKPSSGGGATKSPGCGATDYPKSGELTIDVSGSEREYILKIPSDYDPNEPYKLIFGWHWRGGVASDVSSGGIIGGPYYGLEQRANGSAIFVAPNGIDNGWANSGGRDIAFLKAMLAYFNSKLCIDQSRIFSLGFSFGGMMSNAIGCEMADVFRAIAPMSGALYSGCTQSNDNPVAVWMAHGKSDNVVPLADGKEALAVFLERNGCTDQTMPVQPSPCVAYQGCAAGYPVHYCEFDGGHGPQNFAPQATWDFFSQF